MKVWILAMQPLQMGVISG